MRKFGIIGKKAKYPTLNWFENFMRGHINIGPITIYGENAMHWAVNIRLQKTYMCFRLPFRSSGRWWPLYLYFSPDATPTEATFKWGRI